MQGNRNGGPPLRLPDPASVQYTAQRLVLLELVVDPPAAGDRFDDLCEAVGLSDVDAHAALGALATAGLTEQEGDVVIASTAARYFEHLWPVRP
jgi:hypothetical protein